MNTVYEKLRPADVNYGLPKLFGVTDKITQIAGNSRQGNSSQTQARTTPQPPIAPSTIPSSTQDTGEESRYYVDLSGVWEGFFPCGPNRYVLQFSVSGGNLIQTVISHGGENCLPNGHISTLAQISGNVPVGRVIKSIIYLGTGSQTRAGQIRVIDVNTLDYEGTILHRVRQ